MTKPKQEHELCYGKRWNVGSNNSQWKGDNVGKRALHERMYKLVPNTGLCSHCGKQPKRLELANISQKYLIDPNDWEWLCSSCHFKQDGRVERWKISHKKDHSKTFCLICTSKTTYIRPNGSPNWTKYKDGHICKRCYDRINDRIRWQKFKESRGY